LTDVGYPEFVNSIENSLQDINTLGKAMFLSINCIMHCLIGNVT
jgi:hypothetical protein